MPQKIKGLVHFLITVAVFSALVYFLKGKMLASEHHEINTILPVLIDIAFLALFATVGAKLAKAFGMAPMAGKIIMGVFAGPAVLGILQPDAFGVEFARVVGVLFILFEAGLHFNMDLLKKNWKVATGVAFGGVLIPLVSFAALGHYVIGMEWVPAIFLGGIFTATSVGLSCEALKRVGMLDSDLGNKIVGAAVIDDILGVIILTVLSKLSSGGGHGAEAGGINPFVLLALGVIILLVAVYVMWNMGLADKLARYLNDQFEHNSTGIMTRFFFGALVVGASAAAALSLEPVLGAFGMGVVLSKVDNKIKHEAWHKIEGFMHIFVGGFLVSIGTMLPRSAILNTTVWGWALLFTALAFFGKLVVSLFFKDKSEGRLVGLAMAIRGEVGLVFVAVAIANNALSETMASAALLAVILVTVLGVILFDKDVNRLAPEQSASGGN